LLFFCAAIWVSVESFPALFSAPYHTISVDGNLSEWSDEEKSVADGVDSVWDPGLGINEIKNIYATWDASNLYIAVEGAAENKGLLLYMDSGQSNKKGYGDLRELRTWNRRSAFNGWSPDFFFAAWGSSDGNFYKLSSSWTAEDITSRCSVKGPSGTATRSGWEIKIPFDLIYSRGNSVPPGVSIKIFASLATGDVSSSDFGAYGYLGGDCVPDDNISGLGDVVISTYALISPDAADGDGVPDDNFKGVVLAFKSVTVSPVRFAPLVEGGSLASVVVQTNKEATVTVGVYDIAGRKIKTLSEKDGSPEGFKRSFVWDGSADNLLGGAGGGTLIAPRGVYIISVRATNGSESARVNKAIVVIR